MICQEDRNNLNWTSGVLDEAPRLTPPYRIIFFIDEEIELSRYRQTMSKLHHRLNPKVAYDLAIANKEKITNSSKHKIAGKFWFKSFLNRNAELSLRIAEPTSLSRALEFIRPIVSNFFSNLKTIYGKYQFTPS